MTAQRRFSTRRPALCAIHRLKCLNGKANLFHEELALIPDSGGVGQFRGGLGVRRKVRMIGETEVISMKKKSKTVGLGSRRRAALYREEPYGAAPWYSSREEGWNVSRDLCSGARPL